MPIHSGPASPGGVLQPALRCSRSRPSFSCATRDHGGDGRHRPAAVDRIDVAHQVAQMRVGRAGPGQRVQYFTAVYGAVVIVESQGSGTLTLLDGNQVLPSNNKELFELRKLGGNGKLIATCSMTASFKHRP